MKGTCRARLAAVGAGWALLLAVAAAYAADPGHPPAKTSKPTSTRPAKSARAGRMADAAARRAIAGGPTLDDTSLGVESDELRALRDAERELFPPAAPAAGAAWPTDVPFVVPHDGEPQIHSSGVPPGGPTAHPAGGEGSNDLAWLTRLEMPDLPIRWDERVIRYVEFFRDDPRGRTTFANLFRRSGRARDMMRRLLRKKSLPDDLVWVAMIESGFDPAAHSSAGAAGLWQFMPETAKIYGLSIDHWVDQRFSAQLATAAATDLLSDLHRRFGNWELALAAYNMGYAGLASVVRRYNTNDFWSLSRTEGSLPWETTLYVPKILAAAVVAHNLADFGFGDLAVDTPIESDAVDVPPGTPLALVAQAAGCEARDIESLNPELRAGRTPPTADSDGPYVVKVPQGKGPAVVRMLGRLRKDPSPLDRYVVRFGETLEQVATAHKTTIQRLVELNAIAPGEVVRGGTVLLVPSIEERTSPATPSHGVPSGGSPSRVDPSLTEGSAGSPALATPKPTVVVPLVPVAYSDRRRVFYRVLVGDTLNEIATALHASVDDLRRWNDLDASARLEEGMTLQAFVTPDTDLSQVVVLPESDVRVVTAASDEFFVAFDQNKGFKRLAIAAKAGDTIESIGKRFNVSARTMERVNRRGRGDSLRPGEIVVVYVPASLAGAAVGNATAANAPAPNGPLPPPPAPELLP